MEKFSFRDDIQGLRALAIISVLIFHINPGVLPGGYIGVDIFFTISGFVISQSISRSYNSNSFSLANFYYNRFRRLYPALLATVAATFVVGLFLFPPFLLVQLSKSSIYSLSPIAVVNFYFMLEAGYWSGDSITKPLLHVWSLAVEDQFYLIWPCLMLLLLRGSNSSQKKLLIWISVVTIFGVALSEIGTIYWPIPAFFMVPFRIFEFSIGALVVFLPTRWKPNYIWSTVLSILSICVIIYYFLEYDGSRAFPGLAAVPSVAATALVIFLGPMNVASRLLSAGPMTFIGGISYSMYLVHWPIIVYYSYFKFEKTNSVEQFAIGISTIALGYALNILVERRYRHFEFAKSHTATAVMASTTAFVVIAAATAWYDQGAAWRSQHFYTAETVTQQRDRRFTNIHAMCAARGWATCYEALSSPPASGKKVLVIGDSQGVDALNFAVPIFGLDSIVIRSTPGCPPITLTSPLWTGSVPDKEVCRKENQKRLDPAFLANFDVLVVSNLYSWYKAADLKAFLDQVLKINPEMKIVIMGPYMYLNRSCDEIAQRGGHISCTHDRFIDSKFPENENLKTIAREDKALFIDLSKLCHNGTCPSSINGVPFSWDKHHLSYEFARELGVREAETVLKYVNAPVNRPADVAK